MGLKFDVGEISEQNKAIEEKMKSYQEANNQFKGSIEKFSNTDSLNGKTYESAKRYFSEVYQVFNDLLVSTVSEVNDANQLFLSRYKSQIDANSLDEDVLEQQIADCTRKISDAQNNYDDAFRAKKKNQDKLDAFSKKIKTEQASKRKLEDLLQKLRDYHTSSASIFEGAEGTVALLKQAANSLKGDSAWDSSKGTFMKFGNDYSWMTEAKDITKKNGERRLKDSLDNIKRPEGMSDKEFEQYKATIRDKAEELKGEGWDAWAIVAYVNKVDERVNNPDGKYKGKNAMEILNDINDDLYLVGSEVYEAMFDGSRIPAKEKVALVIKQMGGEFDENGDLILNKNSKYKFNPNMKPGDKFMDDFAKEVQKAYPNGFEISKEDEDLSSKELKKKYPLETAIHQFRNQIDKHNVEYIQSHRKRKKDGMMESDLEVLNRITDGKLMEKDNQYHNRDKVGENGKYRDKIDEGDRLTDEAFKNKMNNHGQNRKVVTEDYHNEFIFDKDGNLVSQWSGDIGDRERAIANGESFNYGNEENDGTHNNLDEKPPRKFDTEERNEVTENWVAPTDRANKREWERDKRRRNIIK